MKKLTIAMLLLTVLLTACAPAQQIESTEPTVIETQAPTDPPPVDIGGSLIPVDTTELDLSAAIYDLDRLLSVASELQSVVKIELGVTNLSSAQVEQLQTAFPNALIDYKLEILGQTVTADTEYLDFSAITPEQAQELMAQLPLVTGLQQINFISEEGICSFTIDDIPVLNQLRDALPEVNFRVSFELFGQTVSSEDARIEYYRVPIGNDGVEQVRAVLPYLTACEYLLLDGCDIDNEVMAQLREDFSETKVVWRVWVAGPFYESRTLTYRCSFLTDTHLIRTINVSDWTCDVLKYCVETKYVDFGHNDYISDCSFLAYMPDLEVAILALTNMHDLSPLANCPKLEYLELFEAQFSDLSPLVNCKNLEHLNIATLPDLEDITPLYELTNLKRLRIIKCPKVPAEQLEEFARRVPGCEILDKGWDETGNGWRFTETNDLVPRYALLCEQMQYAMDRYYK